jgi:trans-aconitate 2-methyltransferase
MIEIKSFMTTNNWNTDLYEDRHQFVWQYGETLLELLAPQPGELILDLGCGTGQLTAKIAATGAKVKGSDFSEAMIAKATQNYPQIEFKVEDARNFQVEQSLDAVFSNAVLHWVKPPEAAIECIHKALKPGGRFVAEFGGKGNVKQIIAALTDIFQKYGYNAPNPWYFPSISEYAFLLESRGLEVKFARLFERATPLADGDRGLANWLKMFADNFLARLSSQEQKTIIEEVTAELKPSLYRNGIWTADYRRIQVMAVKP